MKALAIAMLALCGVLPASAGSDCQTSLREIRAANPCKNQSVKVVAYLNASRHGAWLSESVGSIRNGIPLTIEQSTSDPSIRQVKNYIFRPQDYLNKTFHADFYGTIECGKDKKQPPSIKVGKVRKIQISKIAN